MLFMYFPLRNEAELKFNSSYVNKLRLPGVLEIVNFNIGVKMHPVSDKQRVTLRKKLSEVRVLVIDEISMVSNILFYQLHQMLNEIFGCESNVEFAGLPVLVCDDFTVTTCDKITNLCECITNEWLS